MKNAVIIGGGFAGALAAELLEKDFNVTLIDLKDYFEFTPSVLRTLVEPQHAEKIQVRHLQYLKKTQIVQGHVIDIDEKEVYTASQVFPYDYLVIASGSRYESPIKEAEMVIAGRSKELTQYAEKLRKAQNVLIIGGGIVGVELAAEIIAAFPEKKLTLVHAKEELMERTPPKAREYARKWLEEKGVTIVFNERIINHQKGYYRTETGKSFSSELVFLCTGIRPNYEFLEKHYAAQLDAKHFFFFNEHLQVLNSPTIFAAGDINNMPEEKTAQSAEKQARVVVKNIFRLEKGKPLLHYSSAVKPMVISLGKKDGILLYKNFVLTGFIPSLMKTAIEWKTMRKYK